MDQCDIIIPVWNQPRVTKDCIESIYRHTDYPYRLILIDNGSGPETAGYLGGLKKAHPEIVLVRNERNLGFVKAVNQGIGISDAPYVCVMNNDTIAAQGWLKEMVNVMESNPRIGLLNPSSNTSGQFPGKGQSIDEYALSRSRLKGRIQELYTCRGFSMLIKREVLARLGPMDEGYHMGYFDDTDYCKRAQVEGYRTARAKGSYVYHLENTSFKSLENNNELFKSNERKFFERWGRPLRIGYFIDEIKSKEKIDAIATGAARAGHQIILFLKKGSPWPATLDHFDIRRVDLDPLFFAIVSIYKILKRKRKKKLDFLLTDNDKFGAILKLLKPLHGSDVFVTPDKDRLLEALDERSRKF